MWVDSDTLQILHICKVFKSIDHSGTDGIHLLVPGAWGDVTCSVRAQHALPFSHLTALFWAVEEAVSLARRILYRLEILTTYGEPHRCFQFSIFSHLRSLCISFYTLPGCFGHGITMNSWGLNTSLPQQIDTLLLHASSTTPCLRIVQQESISWDHHQLLIYAERRKNILVRINREFVFLEFLGGRFKFLIIRVLVVRFCKERAPMIESSIVQTDSMGLSKSFGNGLINNISLGAPQKGQRPLGIDLFPWRTIGKTCAVLLVRRKDRTGHSSTCRVMQCVLVVRILSFYWSYLYYLVLYHIFSYSNLRTCKKELYDFQSSICRQICRDHGRRLKIFGPFQPAWHRWPQQRPLQPCDRCWGF